jgi:hypothetical protein
MNNDGMIIIDAEGLVHAEGAFSKELSDDTFGGARQRSAKWIAANCPGSLVVKISEDASDAVPVYMGNEEHMYRLSKVPAAAEVCLDKGEIVSVWSRSQRVWLRGDVEEVYVTNTQVNEFHVIPRGSVRVHIPGEKHERWVYPEDFGLRLRRFFHPGDLVFAWDTSSNDWAPCTVLDVHEDTGHMSVTATAQHQKTWEISAANACTNIKIRASNSPMKEDLALRLQCRYGSPASSADTSTDSARSQCRYESPGSSADYDVDDADDIDPFTVSPMTSLDGVTERLDASLVTGFLSQKFKL